MHSEIRKTEQWGSVLWLQNAGIEIGVALEFGIRIVHLSCIGMENLYYVQPNDLSDNFSNGDWRLYGGHRLWLAPECVESYCPDNAPVTCAQDESSVLITQQPDTTLQVRKSIRIAFSDDGSVILTHYIENLSDKPIIGASWGINSLDGGGVARINFSSSHTCGPNPNRVVALWSNTDLHDKRIHFEWDSVTATHMPLTDYFKIGLYVNPGQAVLTNKGQQLTITFDAEPIQAYLDGGCNFELYMCSRFMELETLGVKTEILPGMAASHNEVWHLKRI